MNMCLLATVQLRLNNLWLNNLLQVLDSTRVYLIIIMLRFTLYFFLGISLHFVAKYTYKHKPKRGPRSQRLTNAVFLRAYGRAGAVLYIGSQRTGDLVVNLEVECYYFSPGARLAFRPLSIAAVWPVLSYMADSCVPNVRVWQLWHDGIALFRYAISCSLGNTLLMHSVLLWKQSTLCNCVNIQGRRNRGDSPRCPCCTGAHGGREMPFSARQFIIAFASKQCDTQTTNRRGFGERGGQGVCGNQRTAKNILWTG